SLSLFFPAKSGLQPEGLLPARGMAGSGLPPVSHIPHCGLPSESGPCLSPSVADHPLRPATDRRLGKPLPHQLANRTSAAPRARGHCWSPAFLLRAYAVLAPLSRRYPPLRDTFRCITHPFAARRQGCPRAAARLACVKHAASVQSEPGSNSSVRSLQSVSLTLAPFPPTSVTR